MISLYTFFYVLTTFLTIYISISYKIPLWKIFILSISPIIFFTALACIKLYPAPIEWMIHQLYQYIINKTMPMYQILFIPLTLTATSIFYLKKRYSFSYIKIFLISIFILGTFLILYGLYIRAIKEKIHILQQDMLGNLFILSIFYYIIIFYYKTKYKNDA